MNFSDEVRNVANFDTFWFLSKMAADILKDVLSSIGLSSVYAKFYEQRIDHGMISGLTDAELTRLGVETIGERYRLREGIKTRVSRH